MPEVDINQKLASDSGVSQLSDHSNNFDFNNEWLNIFGQKTNPPSDSKTSLKKYVRRVFQIFCKIEFKKFSNLIFL